MASYLKTELAKCNIALSETDFRFVEMAIPSSNTDYRFLQPTDPSIPDHIIAIAEKLKSSEWKNKCNTEWYQSLEGGVSLEWGRNFKLDNNTFPAILEWNDKYYAYFEYSVHDSNGFFGLTTNFLNLERCYELFITSAPKYPSYDKCGLMEEMPLNSKLIHDMAIQDGASVYTRKLD